MHDALDTLRNCCLVPKSWIARTRKHLFANIRFHLERDLLSWKKTFPDPSTSPACYAKTLFVGRSHAITTTDGVVGSRVSLASCTWSWLTMLQSPTRRTISPHSMSADSHLLSNLSTCVLSSFRSRKIRPRPFIPPSRKSDRDRPH